MTAIDYALDPLRDVRHSSARAARDLADWLAALDLEGKADRTRYHYALTALDLAEAHPDVALAEFTDGDISHLLRSYPPKGRATRAAHLASLFKWAKLTRRIPENPMDYVPRPQSQKARLPDVFSDAERAGLCSDTEDGRLMTLLFELALRKSEARALQRRHVNLSRAEVSILKGKGDKDRLVPMTPLALQAASELITLEGLDPEDHFWYTKPGGGDIVQRRFLTREGCSDGAFARWYSRCVKAADVRYRKPHTTRHTRATQMRRLGYELDEIQLFLGHASVQTTSDLYVHTNIYDVAARMVELEAGVS